MDADNDEWLPKQPTEYWHYYPVFPDTVTDLAYLN